MSKEFVIVNTLFKSTTAKDNDTIIMDVFPLLLPKLESAILQIFPPPEERFPFFFALLPSVKRNASIGETFAANLAGCPVDINIVTSENAAAPIKITGLTGT